MKSYIVNYSLYICFLVSFVAISLGVIPSVSATLYYAKGLVVLLLLIVSFFSQKPFKVDRNLYLVIILCIFLITMSFLNSYVVFNVIAYSLELIPFFTLVIMWQFGIPRDLVKRGVFVLFVISSILGIIQFLVLPTYYMDIKGHWVLVTTNLPLLMKRPGSIFGNPNVFGCFNALFLSWILFSDIQKRKWWLILCVFINIVLIAKSRSSLAAAILICIFYLYKSGKLKSLATLVVLAALTYSSFLTFIYENEYADQIFRYSDLVSGDTNSFTIRQDIFTFILNKINLLNLFGVGPGNIPLYLDLMNAPWAGPESAGLHLLLEKGVIVYVFYVTFLVALFFSKNPFNKCVLIIFLVNGLLETVSVQHQVLSYIFILLFYSNPKYSLNAI